jgi:hypothetical protein
VSTNIQIISDALLDLGVINESETPSAEQGSHALRKLNEMLEAWEEEGVRLGWCEQTDTSADTPLYPYAIRGVTASLALELAPSYGGAASITPALSVKLEQGMALIYRKAALKNLKPLSMSNMNASEGGGYGYDIQNDR